MCIVCTFSFRSRALKTIANNLIMLIATFGNLKQIDLINGYYLLMHHAEKHSEVAVRLSRKNPMIG